VNRPHASRRTFSRYDLDAIRRALPDPDQAGDTYARAIATTLTPRCRALRVRLDSDINNTAMEAATA
jgi:hypothetical protein